MYHGTPYGNTSKEYSIRSSNFICHLKYLKKEGWKTLLCTDLLNPEKLTFDKSVVITFDDGYANNIAGAYHPLLDLEMKATWFITTDCIGRHASWMGQPTLETEMMTSEQLLELHKTGMEIGSHTCTHPRLSRLDVHEQLNELTKSKSVLENLLSTTITSFAYPYGDFNNETLTAVKTAGYKLACTTQSGWWTQDQHPLLVRRVTMFNNDDTTVLARKLVFADNEVSWFKLVKYYHDRLKIRIQDKQ